MDTSDLFCLQTVSKHNSKLGKNKTTNGTSNIKYYYNKNCCVIIQDFIQVFFPNTKIWLKSNSKFCCFGDWGWQDVDRQFIVILNLYVASQTPIYLTAGSRSRYNLLLAYLINPNSARLLNVAWVWGHNAQWANECHSAITGLKMIASGLNLSPFGKCNSFFSSYIHYVRQ